MATVRFADTQNTPPHVQRKLELMKESFGLGITPNLLKVRARLPDLYRLHSPRPYAPGRLDRGTKELIAACVSALNACHY